MDLQKNLWKRQGSDLCLYTSPNQRRQSSLVYYVYDEYFDDAICPEYKALHYSTTNRAGYLEMKEKNPSPGKTQRSSFNGFSFDAAIFPLEMQKPALA